MAWLVAWLAAELSVEVTRVDVHEQLSRYGLDSIRGVRLAAELSKEVGRRLSPVAVWEYPTIDALAGYVVDGVEPPGPSSQMSHQGPAREPVAVVGLACRFPAGGDPDEYWASLCSGTDAVSEVPPERWDLEKYHDTDPSAPGKMISRWGGFLKDIDRFDASFFGISPREATYMDPQQRLVMELGWEALEDAGIVPGELGGSETGVFVGAWKDDYRRLPIGGAEAIAQHTLTGYDTTILAARLSYKLGLQGPCLTVNTACSSSLVAVHLALQSLRDEECDLALATGVHLQLIPEVTIEISKFGGLSADGRCKTFDAGANGFVRGEGAGTVVLKKLSRALADGDRIYCVIPGSAVNNDGASNGLTAPNPRAQEALLRSAYGRAGLEPSRVHYIEAHGTGTALGDPIEVRALGAVLDPERPPERPLRLGSVKTNIGHLESAAGMAGLIKLALAIHHRAIPVSLHFETPNPNIPFDELEIEVQQKLEPWPSEEERPLSGVSSFGFGGTNAHVIAAGDEKPVARLVSLSASRPEDLDEVAEAFADWVEQSPLAVLEEIAATAAHHLSHHRYRLAVTCSRRGELLEALRDPDRDSGRPGVVSGESVTSSGTGLVFVFPGVGTQWVGMGVDLLEREPVFRCAVERCAMAMEPHVDWNLLEELVAPEGRSRFGEIEVLWPAIFAVHVGLAALWRSWGVVPDAVVGQSMGEIAAAHVAGVLTLEDAARIICHQGRVVGRRIEGGAMAFVSLPWAEVEELLAGHEDRAVAAVDHSPGATVVSGDRALLAELLAPLEERGVFWRFLSTTSAVHSPLMLPILDELESAFGDVRPNRWLVPLVSTVDLPEGEEPHWDAAYFVANVRYAGRFRRALGELLDAGHRTFLELSPHPTMLRAIKDCSAVLEVPSLALPSLRRREDSRQAMLDAAGALYAEGRELRWSRLLDSDFPPLPLSAELESQAVEADPDPPIGPVLLPLSAHSPQALRERVEGLLPWLSEPGRAPLLDICSTAALRRSHHEERLAVVGDSRAELVEQLEDLLDEGGFGAVEPKSGPRPRVAFVFAGQGSQWWGMGQELYREEEVFRRVLEDCDRRLRPLVSWSLLDELLAVESDSRLDQTEIVQVALFALQTGLVALWRSWGIEPAAVTGHSVGEVAAAHAAGALTRDEALRVVVHRARLMQQATGQGKMAALAMPVAAVESVLAGHGEELAVAAINGPASTVVAGDPGGLESLVEQLEAAGERCKMLPVDYAFHSPQMEPYRAQLVEALGEVERRRGEIAFYSTVTGAACEGTELDAAHWGRNVRQPVRLQQAVDAMADDGFEVFLEIGPHPVLALDVSRTLEARGQRATVLPSMRRGESDRRVLLRSLGRFYEAGLEIRWEDLHRDGASLVRFPRFPWQRRRYWVDLVEEAPRPKAAVEESLVDDIYQVDWEVSEPMVEPEAVSACWLVLADRGGVGEALARHLEAMGDTCLVAWNNGLFTDLGNDQFVLDGSKDADLQRMVSVAAERQCRGVVYLWSLDAESADNEFSLAELGRGPGAGTAVRLVQQMAQRQWQEATGLWLISRGAQAVITQEAPGFESAGLWGLGRGIAIEHPELWGGLVDLDPEAEIDRQAAALVTTLRRQDGEDQLAFRQEKRHVARLARAPVPAEAPSFSAEGTYYVTGGLGALGLRAAGWLVEHGARHLVLLGRSQPSQAAAAEVGALEEAGAQVRVAQVDVADSARLEELVRDVELEWPAMAGILHAAGVWDSRPLTEADDEVIDRVLQGKVEGAWNLHRLSLERPCELFVLYSSASAVWGSRNQTPYAAANAFLDGLAYYRRGLGLPALSVQWGPWSGSGMGDQETLDLWSKMGIATLPVASAMDSLGHLISAGVSTAAVGIIDWRLFRPLFEGRLGRRFLHRLEIAPASVEATAKSGGGLRHELAEVPKNKRRETIRERVGRQVAKVLGIPRGESVPAQKGFFDMGVDSLMAVELKNRIEAMVGEPLPPTLTFDYPSIEALSEFLWREVLGLEEETVDPVPSSLETLAEETELDDLSEKDLMSLLAGQLASLEELSS